MLLSVNDIDFVRNYAFYLPPGYNTPEKLDKIAQALESISNSASLAWHLRDHPLQPKWQQRDDSFLIVADHKISKKVKVTFNHQNPERRGKAIIYPTSSKRGFLKIEKEPSSTTSFEFIQYTMGKNTSISHFVNHWDGNSLLFQMTPTTYLEITGEQVYTYTLSEEEEIMAYYSPLLCHGGMSSSSNLRSPHAFAVTTNNNLLYRGMILRNTLVYPPTAFFSLKYSQCLKELTCPQSDFSSHYGPSPKVYKEYQLPGSIINKSDNIQGPTLGNLLPIKNLFDVRFNPRLAEQLQLISIEYAKHLNPRFLNTSIFEVMKKTRLYPHSHIQSQSNEDILSLLLPQNELPRSDNSPAQIPKLTQQIMGNGYSNFELRVNQSPPPKTIEHGHYQTLPEINTTLENYQTDGVIRIYDKYIWEKVHFTSAEQRTKSIQSYYGDPCYIINPNDYKEIILGFNGAGSDYYWLQNNGHGNTLLIHMSDNSYVQVKDKITRFSLPDPEDKITVYYSPIGPNDVPYPFALTEKGFIVFNGSYIPVQHYSLPKTPLWSYLLFQQLYGNISNLATQDASKVQKIETIDLVIRD